MRERIHKNLFAILGRYGKKDKASLNGKIIIMGMKARRNWAQTLVK